MSQANGPDRRILFNAIVGVLILGIAAALFWPRGGADHGDDSLVLTPEEVSAESTGDDAKLQASVESTPVESVPAPSPIGLDAANKASDTALNAQTKPIEPPQPAAKTKTATTLDAPKAAPTSKLASGPRPTSSGRFFLVVGSYSEAANAQREVARLDAAGIDATSVAASKADGSVHRIHVGYFASQADAEAYGRKLKQSMGLDYWVGTR